MKNVKLLITVFLISIVTFFSCQKDNLKIEYQSNVEKSLGAIQDDPKEVAKVPLYKNSSQSLTSLPSSFVLNAPIPGNQGSEGSCMSFSVASTVSIEWYYRYAYTSFSNSTNVFSPEYLYDYAVQTPGSCGSGSSLLTNLNLVRDSGVCTWATLPYTSGSCTPRVTSAIRSDAVAHKLSNYSRLICNDTNSIKNYVYTKHPVIVSITVDNNFKNAKAGYIWKTYGTAYGSHAFIIIGWDDSKHAYKIMNSWGTSWGDAGFLWVDYGIISNKSFYYVYYFN